MLSTRNTRQSVRLRTIVATSATALLFAAGTAYAADPCPDGGPHVELSCDSGDAVHFGAGVTDSVQPDAWTSTSTWNHCRTADDQPATTGDAAVRENGVELLSCNAADIKDATFSYEISWANGTHSRVEGHEAVDLRQDGEGLLKFTGRVVDGIYAGDDFTETSTAATTDPGQCEGRGISNEAGEGSIVLTHP
jgi:hypothetical protein